MLRYSVATKIEIGLKMNTKILQFLKIDRRRIRRIFINSKILRRLQFLRISSKQKNLTLCVGKLKFKVLKEVHILDFFRNFVQNIVKFSRKIFAIFGLKSSKLRRFFSIWKWTEDEDKDGSVTYSGHRLRAAWFRTWTEKYNCPIWFFSDRIIMIYSNKKINIKNTNKMLLYSEDIFQNELIDIRNMWKTKLNDIIQALIALCGI